MSERSIKRQRERRIERQGRLGRRRTRAAAGLVVGTTALAAPAAAQAATYTVDVLTDGAPSPCGVGNCTLRDAVTLANGNAGPDTIVFNSGLSGDITLSGGELPLTDAAGVTIDGPDSASPDRIVVDADFNSRAFYVLGTATVNDLTVRNGFEPFGTDPGGGFLVAGPGSSLDLDRMLIRGSTSKYGFGGGVAAAYDASATITNSTISGNRALAGSGLSVKYGATMDVSDTTVKRNGGGDYSVVAGGVGVSKYGSFTGDNVTIRGNQAKYFGGGLVGGYTSDTTVDNSTISGNSSNIGGGAVYFGYLSSAPGSFAIDHTALSGNYASLGGGFIIGGIPAGGTVGLSNSTLSSNVSSYAGPDSTNFYGGLGGGVAISGDIEGAAALSNLTISGNEATVGGGISLGFPTESVMRKKAAQRADEAGIPEQMRLIPEQPQRLVQPGGSLSLNSLTVANNSASEKAGGFYLGAEYDGGAMIYEQDSPELINTIVADNQVGTAAGDLAQANEGGGFILNRSLIQTPGAATVTQNPAGASILGEDPLLGSLRNNGGPTKTILPANDSPVINAGGTGLTTDQRGFARPSAGGDDIGAVELQLASVAINSGPTGKTSKNKPTFKFTADPSAGSTFQCSVDGGAYKTCTSPYTTSKLADGKHTFAVRAVTAEGPGPEATRSFTVDTKVKGAKIKAAKNQKIKGSKVVVKVKAGAGEKVTGKPGGKLGKYALKAKKKTIKSGKLATFKLKPKKSSDSKKIVKLLNKGKTLKAKLTVKLTDEAGNSKKLKAKSKVK